MVLDGGLKKVVAGGELNCECGGIPARFLKNMYFCH